MIAERRGLEPDDLSVRATAGFTLDVFQLIDRRDEDPRNHREILVDLLSELPHCTIVFPADTAS